MIDSGQLFVWLPYLFEPIGVPLLGYFVIWSFIPPEPLTSF